MALFDNPPHRITIYGPVTSSADSGGGTVLTYGTTRQAAVPCSINTLSGAEAELFQQQGLTVTHVIGIRSAALTAAVARGDKAVADDTGETFIINGIRAGRGYGNTPAFTYLQVESQL